MMFHDSMAMAQEKMTKVCQFLEQNQLPPTPLNYHIGYVYISQTNRDLTERLDRDIRNRVAIDSIYIEQLYYEYLQKEHQTEANLIQQVGGMIDQLNDSAQQSQQSLIGFAKQINHCLHNLDEHNVVKTRAALKDFGGHTEQLLKQHQQFKNALRRAREIHEKQQQQLLKLRKQRILDPQTGLYKRHYLGHKTQLWLTQDKSICAISVLIENLDAFSQDFGELVGETVLQRVAKRIQKYVLQSGLPGRTGKQEFTIVLADCEVDTAVVVAEKIRRGVTRLKFVSAKGDVSFPDIDLAIGIAQHQPEHDFNTLSQRAAFAAKKAQSLGQNYYISAPN
ncbi:MULTISPECIES: GGDEF domain-containing protein [unclassified Pseudoalteromonas]|uniref:GGDEF domain-containing protein n=1 Tax=unclassified Pseudoalteromonas TaxID=194690 RepID=UPI0020982589|nr:GGDEF domain-containing protein [Pseudoalteromonas sp. XMcav2-N]MCO7190092.1 GGDEF domain-containing protein [Pseudoalteromonas sp. XMcav2-N]